MPDCPMPSDDDAGERLLAEAESRINEKDFAGAREAFLEAAEHLPEHDPRVTFGLHMTHLALQEEARERAMTARLEENPGDLDAMFRKGDALRRNGKVDEALEVFAAAVAAAPELARSHYELALTLHCWARDYAAALPHYGRALTLTPGFQQALHYRGIAHRELERFEEAVADFDALEALSPEHPQLFANRGLALAGAGRHLAAEADFTRVLAETPEAHYYVTRRGLVRLALERLDEALADFEQALALRAAEALRWYDPEEDEGPPDPDPDPDALRGRAEVRLRRGEREAARADFEAAMRTYRQHGQEAAAEAMLVRLAIL